MFRSLLAFLAIGLAAPVLAQEVGPDPETEVMILGMFHLANPGQDGVNMEIDDVLQPKRQSELEAIARAFAEWKPTKVLVELQAQAPEFRLESFARTDELLTTRRNESVQIGYRLAKMLGHEDVYGFDEQPSDGEPDYFPMGRVMEFARKSGQAPLIQQLIGEVQAEVGAQQAALATQTLAEALMPHNDPALVGSMHDKLYYSMLQIGDGDDQPGAEVNAYWYMRNAKMYAKLGMIAEPGDRLFVIVGSGHSTWLRHFAEHTPGYELVEPMPYLEAAAAGSETMER